MDLISISIHLYKRKLSIVKMKIFIKIEIYKTKEDEL